MGTIRDWPAGERPREKLLDHGPQALSDAELLAIFLRTGVKRENRRGPGAGDCCSRIGGLRALLEADRRRFCATAWTGLAKYAQLQAVLEMARRHLAEPLRTRGPARESRRHPQLPRRPAPSPAA